MRQAGVGPPPCRQRCVPLQGVKGLVQMLLLYLYTHLPSLVRAVCMEMEHHPCLKPRLQAWMGNSTQQASILPYSHILKNHSSPSLLLFVCFAFYLSLFRLALAWEKYCYVTACRASLLTLHPFLQKDIYRAIIALLQI